MEKETDKRLIIEALAKKGLMLTKGENGIRSITYISNIPAFRSEHDIDFEIPSISNQKNCSLILDRYMIQNAVEIKQDEEEYYADVVMVDGFFITLPLREELSITVYKKNKEIADLTDEEKIRILDYCLGKWAYNLNEEVYERDIFLQGEFIEKVELDLERKTTEKSLRKTLEERLSLLHEMLEEEKDEQKFTGGRVSIEHHCLLARISEVKRMLKLL